MLFEKAQNLRKIVIPSCINKIEPESFTYCISLTNVTFESPSTLTRIEYETFYRCTSLKEIKIPSSVTHIETCAFDGCTSLKEIIIPSSVTHIETDVFCGCTSLKEVKYPSSKYSIKNVDDYNLREFEDQDPSSMVLGTNKKTGQKVIVKFYHRNYYSNILVNKQMSEISDRNIPGLVKVLGYRTPLFNDDEEQLVKVENDENTPDFVDASGHICICEYMKNGDISRITQIYLQKKGKIKDPSRMNPTIRSKIIFGVAATLKQLHKINQFPNYLLLRHILLDDNFEPRLSSYYDWRYYAPIDGPIGASIDYCLAPEYQASDDAKFPYSDVFTYAILLYRMFSNSFVFNGRTVRTSSELVMKIARGLRPERPNGQRSTGIIPDCYWDLIEQCWKQDPEDRPTFEQITNILKNDEFALEEFGMKTDLDQLHEYQQRIDID